MAIAWASMPAAPVLLMAYAEGVFSIVDGTLDADYARMDEIGTLWAKKKLVLSCVN
mgnify:CR=1 FL=1